VEVELVVLENQESASVCYTASPLEGSHLLQLQQQLIQLQLEVVELLIQLNWTIQDGTNSVFSTITSAGGGGGGYHLYDPAGKMVVPGGSGGGGVRNFWR
jgi:hypothetical protein